MSRETHREMRAMSHRKGAPECTQLSRSTMVVVHIYQFSSQLTESRRTAVRSASLVSRVSKSELLRSRCACLRSDARAELVALSGVTHRTHPTRHAGSRAALCVVRCVRPLPWPAVALHNAK